jgi:2-oxoglutarate ferredoxin oxidoreductase subunit delta
MQAKPRPELGIAVAVIHNAGELVTDEAKPTPAVTGKKVRGTVYVTAARCKGCGFCIAFCPPQVLEFSEEFNAQGYHPPRLSKPNECTGCDLCGLYCPDFAIYGVIFKNGSPPAGAESSAEGAAP